MAIFFGKRFEATLLDSKDQVVAEGETSFRARGVEMEFWPRDPRGGDIALKPPASLELKSGVRFQVRKFAHKSEANPPSYEFEIFAYQSSQPASRTTA